MKNLLIAISIILALASTSVEARMATVIAGGGVVVAANECDGYLICQNLEGSGWDNSETWTEVVPAGCTINEDYTTVHLRGDQSYYVGSNQWEECNAEHTFTASANVYAFFRIYISSTSTNTLPIVEFRDATDAIVLKLNKRATAAGKFKLYLKHGSNDSDDTADLDVNTTYFMWMEYLADTDGGGDSGIGRLYISTTKTKPAVTLNLTAGNGTTNADTILFNGRGDNHIIIVDQIYVKTTGAIGDVAD